MGTIRVAIIEDQQHTRQMLSVLVNGRGGMNASLRLKMPKQPCRLFPAFPWMWPW